MIPTARVLVLALLPLALAPGPSRAGFPPEGRLTLSSYKVRQGEVLLVAVHAPRDVAALEGQLLARKLEFYPTADGDYEALAGVDLATKPGFYETRITLRSPEGQTAMLRKDFEVKEGRFSVDKLNVPDQMVDFDPETEARVEADQKRTREAISVRTPREFGTSFALPVAGRVTSSFGRRRILNGKMKSPHGGTDIKAPLGAVVKASAPGTVVLAEEQVLPGNAVIIDHGKGVFTAYYHLREIRVQVGQKLDAEESIGFVGMTGRVTGPHLHWQAWIGGARVDPTSLGRARISEPATDEPESPAPAEADQPSRS